jgi:hypothetical protein
MRRKGRSACASTDCGERAKLRRDDYVVFVAFSGGVTWASSVWKL